MESFLSMASCESCLASLILLTFLVESDELPVISTRH